MSNGPYIVDENCLVFAKNIEEENERLRAENEKLHRETAIRIDQIEREQEAHLKTMADLYYQAEMNARLLTENASFRGEIEKLRRDVKTAVMGDSAELTDVKRENEKLRSALKPFADAVKNEYNWKYDINVDDFRAAAAALKENVE